ncbi:choice-of-anchor L domain-containing protein, partial [Flavobacterium hauense]
MRKQLLAMLLLLGTICSYAQSNLSVFSTNPDNSYIAGETLTWTVMITNNGPQPANNVRAFYAVPTFIMPIPAGITRFSWFKGDGTGASGTNTDLSNFTSVLAVGETVTYTLKLKVPSNYTGTIPQMQVTYSKSADLEVINTDGQVNYTPGTQVVYNVSVINHGPEVANPVSLAMAIPAGITNFSWTGSNGSSGTNAALNNTIGTLAVNQTVTYTVTVDVPASYSGPLTTQAVLTSPNTVDPVPGCTQCTDTDTSLLDADVVVVNTNNQSTYVAGGTTVYTVTVTNNGPASATNVVVNNAIPAGITNFSWTGSNGSSGTNVPLANTIGTMALNQTVTYTITVGVPVGFSAPTLVSQTVVTSDRDANPVCPQCTDTDINPTTGADLVVVNTNGQTVYTPGTQVTYTITVTNNGPGTATGVNVSNAIPAGITAFNWSGSNASAGANTPLSNSVASLPPGGVITYTVLLQIPANYQGDLVSQTVVTSNNDPNPACTQCIDVDTSSTPTVNLVVTNTNGQDIYTPGANSVYTVTVTNNGPYAASNVVVSNPIPAGITAFSWTGSNGSSGTNTALNNTLPTLAAGTTITYTITLGVPLGYTGNLASTASVTTSSNDPVPGNNTATDTDSNVLSADLVVTKTLNQGNTYTAGADLIYTITVNNLGPTAASNISVTDAIPAGLSAAASVWTGSNGSAGTGDLSDVIPTLAVGQTVTYTLTIPVPSNYNILASITNQVVVTSATPDPNPACPTCTHTATPNPQANLVTWKTNGQTEYQVNAQTTYTIVVTNPGPSDAHNVIVHDSKPFNVNLMTWEGNNTGGSGTLHNVIPLLAAGQSMEYKVTIFVEPNHATFVGPLVNVVNVTSSTPDPIPACPGCTDRDTPKVGYVTVDRFAYTREELVNDVLINTDCISITNITSNAGDINANSATQGYGMGYFDKNNSTFPIKDGIILRSGNIELSEGKYNTPFPWEASSTATNQGDTELNYLNQNVLGNPRSMMDVTYLQFDFVPLSDKMSFDFLFAGNEYGFYQCDFFDVFGFLLSNLTNPSPVLPGAPFDSNIAVIPFTTTPVSVLTIRDMAYNNGCASANVQWFGQYNVTNVANSAINMNGQTKVMTASATVIPGDTYRIKLAVGDYGDTAFDIAVFIAGGSFNIGQPKLPTELTLGNDRALCPNEVYVIQPILSTTTPFNLFWEKDGVTILNPDGTPVTTPTYTVTEAGEYTLKAAFPSAPGCYLSSSMRIEYRPDIEVAEPIDLIVCGDPSQPHVFDLHDNDVIRDVLPDPDEVEIEYYHSMEEIENGDPMIWYDPATGYMGNDGEEIFIKIVAFANICYTVKTFNLRIFDCNIEMEPYTAHVCEPAPYDGFEIFDLTSYTDVMTVEDPVPASYAYTFYNSQADAEAENNPITNPTTYSGTTEIIWVRVDNSAAVGVNAYGIGQLSLIVDPQPVVAAVSDVIACGSYTLPALTMGNYYSQPGGAGTQLNPALPLTSSQTVYIYAVQGTAPNTCTDEESFDVTIYPKPTVEQRADLQACDAYELTPLTVGGYYTAAGGTGTQLFPGDFITTTQTIYIYAVTGDATTICSDESDFVVTINSAPVVTPATPLEACADNFDGRGYFDLTVAGAEIVNGQPGLTVTYHNTAAAAAIGVSAITTPTNYYTIVGTVYASVVQTGTTTNCRAVEPIQLIVHPRPAVPVMTPYALCDDNTDGIQIFDLTTKDLEATGGDTSLTVTYYTNQPDALGGTSPITNATAYPNATANTQQVWVRIATGFGCRSVAPFTLIVNPLPVLSSVASDYIINECEEVPDYAYFHLDEIALSITDGAVGYITEFYPTQSEAVSPTGPALANPHLGADSNIYARVTDGSTGCVT